MGGESGDGCTDFKIAQNLVLIFSVLNLGQSFNSLHCASVVSYARVFKCCFAIFYQFVWPAYDYARLDEWNFLAQHSSEIKFSK